MLFCLGGEDEEDETDSELKGAMLDKEVCEPELADEDSICVGADSMKSYETDSVEIGELADSAFILEIFLSDVLCTVVVELGAVSSVVLSELSLDKEEDGVVVVSDCMEDCRGGSNVLP